MNSRRWALCGLILAAIVASAPTPTLAKDTAPISGEFGLLLGANWASANYFLPGDGPSMSPLFGLRMASRFHPRWNWFADGTYSQPGFDANGDVKMYEVRTGFERLIPMGTGDVNWFFSGAIGAGEANYPPGLGNFGRPLYSFGTGVAGANGGLRVELRGENWFGNGGLAGANLINGQLIFGYSFGFHPAAVLIDEPTARADPARYPR